VQAFVTEMADQRQVASMVERQDDPRLSRAADTSHVAAVLAGVQARRKRRPARGLRPGPRLRAAPLGNYRRPWDIDYVETSSHTTRQSWSTSNRAMSSRLLNPTVEGESWS
jgi:hypothetical protein